jgi:hypothetical protein
MRIATTRAAFVSLALFGLFGCDDAPSERGDSTADVVRPPDARRSDWIAVNDTVDPAVWMIEKETGRAASADDSRVRAARRALDSGGERFLESRRMLANRTVQLGQMLAADGTPESYLILLTSLTELVSDVSHGRQTYGDLCQFYLNLRRAGVAREAALEQLKERLNRRRP